MAWMAAKGAASPRRPSTRSAWRLVPLAKVRLRPGERADGQRRDRLAELHILLDGRELDLMDAIEAALRRHAVFDHQAFQRRAVAIEEAAAQCMRALLVELQLLHDEGRHALLDLAIEVA